MSRLRTSLWIIVLSSQVTLTMATAQVGFQVPANYLSRLSNTELAASNETGFGVRFFPLPVDTDLRVTLAKQPNYWEYNINSRQRDTTFGFGVYNNGNTALTGVPKFEISHNPRTGVQFSGIFQHLNGILPINSFDPFSRVTAGYAFTVWNNRIRVLNNVGLGYKTITNDKTYAVTKEVFAPYTQSEVTGGYTHNVNQQFSVRLNSTGRLFTFPMQHQYQASIDFTPGIHFKPFTGVDFDLSELERFPTQGAIPISDLNFSRYSESYFTASYRLPGSPDFSIGMVRSRLTKNWIGDSGNAYLRNDVLFNLKALPVLIGPSVGYKWSKAGNSWLISLATIRK